MRSQEMIKYLSLKTKFCLVVVGEMGGKASTARHGRFRCQWIREFEITYSKMCDPSRIFCSFPIVLDLLEHRMKIRNAVE